MAHGYYSIICSSSSSSSSQQCRVFLKIPWDSTLAADLPPSYKLAFLSTIYAFWEIQWVLYHCENYVAFAQFTNVNLVELIVTQSIWGTIIVRSAVGMLLLGVMLYSLMTSTFITICFTWQSRIWISLQNNREMKGAAKKPVRLETMASSIMLFMEEGWRSSPHRELLR